MSTTISPREVLRDNLAKLSENDQRFATSLLSAVNPTDKQNRWIMTLAERAVTPTQTTAKVSNVADMVEFIGRARGKLVYPKIVFNIWYENSNTTPPRKQYKTIRLSIAGDRAKHPGSINVIDYETRNWCGRVHTNGDWEPSPSLDKPLTESVFSGLLTFAKNPAKIASQYGLLTGNCCFCLLPLTDERSTKVGYGRTCAGNYDLPWGE